MFVGLAYVTGCVAGVAVAAVLTAGLRAPVVCDVGAGVAAFAVAVGGAVVGAWPEAVGGTLTAEVIPGVSRTFRAEVGGVTFFVAAELLAVADPRGVR